MMNYNTSPFSETFPTHIRAIPPSTQRSAFAKTILVWLLPWGLLWKPRPPWSPGGSCCAYGPMAGGRSHARSLANGLAAHSLHHLRQV